MTVNLYVSSIAVVFATLWAGGSTWYSKNVPNGIDVVSTFRCRNFGIKTSSLIPTDIMSDDLRSIGLPSLHFDDLPVTPQSEVHSRDIESVLPSISKENY